MRWGSELIHSIPRENLLGFACSVLVHVTLIAAFLYASLSPATPPSGSRLDQVQSIVTFDVAIPKASSMSAAEMPAIAPHDPPPLAAQIVRAHPEKLELPRNAAIGDEGIEATLAPERSPSALESRGSTAGSPSAAVSTTGSSAYPRELLAHIRPYFRYPDDDARPQGPPRVGVALSRTGQITRIWLVDTSGSDALDRAAMDAIQRSNPMPPIPADLPDRISIVVPVDFSRIVIGRSDRSQ